jgi:hypothetical protein
MWLQFEVVRGPVGVVRGEIWGPLGPTPAPNRPQTIPTGLRTTSECSHMSCSHIHFELILNLTLFSSMLGSGGADRPSSRWAVKCPTGWGSICPPEPPGPQNRRIESKFSKQKNMIAEMSNLSWVRVLDRRARRFAKQRGAFRASFSRLPNPINL